MNSFDRFPYILIFIISAIICMLLAVVALLSRHRVTRAKPFAMMALGSSLWMLSVSLDVVTNSLIIKNILVSLIPLFIFFTLIGLFMFSMQLSLHLKTIPKAVTLPLAFITLAITVFTATNSFHHLIATFELVKGFYIRTNGDFYLVMEAFIFILAFSSLAFLIRALLLSKGIPRMALSLLLVGIIIPTIVTIASDFLGWDPFQFIDEPALSIIIPVILIGWVTFRFNTLNLMPVASNAIMKSMKGAVLVADAQETIIFSNPAAQLILEKAETHLNGKHVLEILENWLPEAALAWKEKKEETQLIFNRDKVKYFILTISELRNSGEFTGYLLMLNNNTEQKNYENQLKTIISAIGDPLFIIDRKTGSIFDVNDSACSLYGYSRDEMLQLKVTDMSAEPEETEKALQAPDCLTPVRYHKKKDGTIFIVEITSSFFELNGRSVLASSMRDISERKSSEKALQESEALFRGLTENSISGIYIINDGVFSYVNPALELIFGYKPGELTGADPLSIIHPDDRPRVNNNIKNRLAGKVKAMRYELKGICKDGEAKYIEVFGSQIEIDKKTVLIGNIIDITARKQAELALVESQSLTNAIVDSTTDMIWSVDPVNFGLLTFNNGLRDSFIHRRGINIRAGMRPEELFPPGEFVKKWHDLYRQALKGSPYTVEYNAFAGSRILQLTFNLLKRDEDLFGISVFARDITEQKNTEEKIIHLSFHDQLTGLYNRRFFEEELKRLDTDRQLPLSFIMGDLNSLKIVNDVFGHNKGDNLLKETSRILKTVCRSDDILARWGGDEFVVLLPRTSVTDSEEIIDRVKNSCKNANTQKIPVSLSLGAATKEKPAQDIQGIIIDAESNMYKNKLAQKESLTSSIIFALDTALYEKSNETKEHTDRLRELALCLGKSIKLRGSDLDELSLLASLHDIGKVAIPEKILLKKGRLTKKEWAVIKRHPEIGFNIAQSSPQIAHVAKAILACHENFDGSGYPLGLKGEAIPIISRIILIADAFDVMISKRTYKEPLCKDDAISELKRCAGSQFDPVLVEKFIEIVN